MQIPLVMFLLTHAYFCLYHALSNVVIRRTLWVARARGAGAPWLYAAVAIFVLAYVTALMETLTIMHVRSVSTSATSLHGIAFALTS